MYIAPGIKKENRCSRANNSKVNNPIRPKFKLKRLSFYACPHYLQVWQRPNQRWLRKAGDIIFFTAEGQVTPKWLVRYDQNSNLSEILCLSSFPVSLMKSEFIVTEKRWRHHFPHSKSMGMLKAYNSVVSGSIWQKFELVLDFMHVLVTCKYKTYQITINREKVETLFSPL